MKTILFGCALLFATAAFSLPAAAQAKNTPQAPASAAVPAHVRSSPAYSEVLLRKTELESDLESMLIDYTEDYPKIRETRHELAGIQKAVERLSMVKAADAGKLTLGLGKIMVRQAAIETELWNLEGQYKDGHPEVKRAKKKLEIFDRAIGEVLN
jgi:hypothetical protein